MAIYRIWERGVYEACNVEAVNMRKAVALFASCEVLHLSGSPTLSTKMNNVRWIDAAGLAREFTAYEIHPEL